MSPFEIRKAGPSRYARFVPPGQPPADGWPAILFLHGAGERGSDGLAPTRVGIGPHLRPDYPAVVVFPQCLKNRYWPEPEMMQRAMAAFEDGLRDMAIDRRRVYLTGISMGGYGSWLLGALHSTMLAAIVTVCGGFPPSRGLTLDDAVDRLKHIPIWNFHGAQDDIIPVDESRRLVARLQAAGSLIRYTEYPHVMHNSWDPAYATPELWPWLFDQKLTTF